MKNRDNLGELIRMCCREADVPDAELQRRIMLHTLTRVVEKSRRRSRMSLISSLAVATVSFCCVVFLLLNYVPARILVVRMFDWTSVADRLLPPDFAPEWIQAAEPLHVLFLMLLLTATMCWAVCRSIYS